MPLQNWRGARVVEWARLESECTLYGVPRVRIPPSPLKGGCLTITLFL